MYRKEAERATGATQAMRDRLVFAARTLRDGGGMPVENASSVAPVDVAQVHRAVVADLLPDYAEMMAAFHRAFAGELQGMIADVWPVGAQRLLDLASGDGCYSVWLAEQAGGSGSVASVDVSPSWLKTARQSSRRAGTAGQVRMIAGDAMRLPFDNDAFDFAWCAQSLYSLPRPDRTLAELRRVLRPGGRLAVLENDTLHQLLLPWDAELELRVRAAELIALRRRCQQPAKFYIGRSLQNHLCDAGFVGCQTRVYASHRRGPLHGDARRFVREYLRSLRQSVKQDLARSDLEALDRLIEPGDRSCLLDSPCATIVCLDYLAWGEKPETNSGEWPS